MTTLLSGPEIVNALASKYNLKSMLEIRSSGDEAAPSRADQNWFRKIDRILYGGCPPINDGRGVCYATKNLFWHEIAETLYIAKNCSPIYDIIVIHAQNYEEVSTEALRAAWNLLLHGGLLIVRSMSQTHPTGTIRLALDLKALCGSTFMYTVDADVHTAVARRTDEDQQSTQILQLLWSIVREDRSQIDWFISQYESDTIRRISVDEFVAWEGIEETTIRRMVSARLYSCSPMALSGELQLDPALVSQWVLARPWIDRDDADIEGYVGGLRIQPTYDLFTALQSWRDFGYVVFENVVTDQLLDQLLLDLEEVKSNHRAYSIPIEVRGLQTNTNLINQRLDAEAGVKINHIHNFSRAAARLSLTYEVCDFLRHVFQAPPAVMQSLSSFHGSEQPIQVDFPFVRHQKKLPFLAASWIPLEDVNTNAGPLAYYPGGHKLSASSLFDWGGCSIVQQQDSERTPVELAEFLQRQMNLAGISKSQFCPKRGDVLVWHGNLPHEGTKVDDPQMTRKSYVTHFTSLPNLPDWQRGNWSSNSKESVKVNGGMCFMDPAFVDLPRLPSWTLKESHS